MIKLPKPKQCLYHFSVDPSINNMGIAVWKQRKLVYWYLLNPTVKTNDYREKAVNLFTQIKDIYEELKDCQVICEGQQQFGVAGFLSRESGSIQKLIYVTGMISSLPDTVIVDPKTWKGQWSKEVTANRLDLIYPDLKVKEMDHNIVDAIAIGHKILYGKL
jgi:hypothetical protein